MLEEAPPFRPESTAEELVAEFTNSENRMKVFRALYARGEEVLPAIRKGFQNADWQVRRWCALFADNFADSETLHALTSLLNDPKSQVRLWAVHALSCETCKEGPTPIDAVPLLLDRIKMDKSIKVRRQAVAVLAHHRKPDSRVLPIFVDIMAKEDDHKLRLHAEQGLKRYTKAGLHI